MKLKIKLEKSYNHYDCTDKELYDIIQNSLFELNSLYKRLDEIPNIYEEEKISLYNIIDIFWNIELERNNKGKVEVSPNE